MYALECYDPTNGRFTSRDPIGFPASGESAYRYAGNDPSNHVDPSGTQIEHIPVYDPSKFPGMPLIKSPLIFPVPRPGGVNVFLCCRPLTGMASNLPGSHCFIIVSNSNGQLIYYTGLPNYNPNPGRPVKSCTPTIMGLSGAYGTGYEYFISGTDCVPVALGASPAVMNCLQKWLSWFNSSSICYYALGPNSNTLAYTLLLMCLGKRSIPPTLPVMPGRENALAGDRVPGHLFLFRLSHRLCEVDHCVEVEESSAVLRNAKANPLPMEHAYERVATISVRVGGIRGDRDGNVRADTCCFLGTGFVGQLSICSLS